MILPDDEVFEDTTTGSDAETELISRAKQSFNSSIDENVIQLHHSFGYDCKKMYNLVMMDGETLVFASGNLIHFFDVPSQTIKATRRSAGGGGIGYLIKNPNPAFNHLTVAENGRKPTIYIYQYPEMKLVAALKKGTRRQFSILDYTRNGEWLASQGGDPDYLLTIWDWKKKEIKLRAKSFSNDVVNLMFSPFIHGHLTTCGLGHIKFWKMATTFTGLKLQGLIGRFGKTEICDIYGMCPMPDEKVLSGCEWGNILVWENGLIKLEVCRKNRRPCHAGPITQIFMKNAEEVMTVGTDGFVRIWFWETVELSDPPEDNLFVEIEPSCEFRIGSGTYSAELLKVIKISEDDSSWYAQDGFGGIWWCDLSTEIRPRLPKQLYRCHAGEIVAVDTSPVTQQVATLGKDGRLYIYDYLEKSLIFHHQFPALGGDLIWLPLSVDATGSVIIAAFSDGVVRVISFTVKHQFQLVQVLKCHCKPITKVSINPKGNLFLTASEDSSIFIHQMHRVDGEMFVKLVPIGFVTTPSIVTCVSWNPQKWSSVILGCKLGDVVQIELPETSAEIYTETTYQLKHLPINHFKFKSIKSQIKRNERIKQIEQRREEKRERKLRELEEKKKENPRLDVDAFLADSEDEEEVLEPIYIPDPPNSILWIQFTIDGTLWLSMAGFDAGYVYELSADDGDLMSFNEIPEAADVEMHSYLVRDDILILGMGDGQIRINRIKDGNWRNLTDFWTLSMHDNFFGRIPRIVFSFDGNFLCSVGADGNLFVYKWNISPLGVGKVTSTPVDAPKLTKTVFDIDDPTFLSLEQQKEKENEERKKSISNENKDKVKNKIEELRNEFNEISKKNELLPLSQKLTLDDLKLDERITEDLQEKLDFQMSIVRRKKQFDFEKVKLAGKKIKEHFIDPIDFPIQVIGINNGKSVFSFRIRKLGEDFFRLEDEWRMKKTQELAKKKLVGDIVDASHRTTDTEISVQPVESFLIGLNSVDIETKIESKMRRLLNKYRERKSKELARKKEWLMANSEKPDPNLDHPSDKKLIEEATQTIGNYKLKTDPNYEVNEDERETVVKKIEEVLNTRRKIYENRDTYNQKIFSLRNKKKDLLQFIEKKLKVLQEIHKEIPEGQRVSPHIDVKFNFDAEFPERNLSLRRYLEPETYDQKYLIGIINEAAANDDGNDEKYLINLQRDVLADEDDSAESKWENEIKILRTNQRLVEQQQIIDKINSKIEEFDAEIDRLSDERVEIEVQGKFKELFLLTLNHELMILRDFEFEEENLVENVNSKDSERRNYAARMLQSKREIDMIQYRIEELHENKRKIEHKFNLHCLENKFTPFFKRIFRRRFDEKIDDDHREKEASLSGESTSSAESSIAGSLKEFKVGMRHLREDQCPRTCDKKLYNLVFEFRSQRHELEREIFAKEREMREHQEEFETLTHRQAKAEREFSMYRKNLTELRQKKQKMLNEVDTIVCLKMDQMQYFKTQREFEDISNTLLFNNHNLLRLYSRVGRLALETIEAKRKHRINVVHLAKMKTDIKSMEKQIFDLRDETSQAMLKKFGRVIDLNEVEETILRRFAFEMQVEMRGNNDTIKRHYNEKINQMKKMKIEREETLNRVIQESTEKLNILTVLEEEKNFLHRAIAMQRRKKEAKSTPTAAASSLTNQDLTSDLSKLKEISNHQKEQIDTLHREIKALSSKTRPLGETRNEFEIITSLQTREDRGAVLGFEDSICSNPDESMLSSTRATTPDNEPFNEMWHLVKNFLSEHLGEGFDDAEVEDTGINMAKYLTNIAVTFQTIENDEFFQEIVANITSFLPKDSKVPAQKIVEFISVNLNDVNDANDVNRVEVLREIICNTIEMSQTAISSTSYLQHILSEIFKQLIITLRFSDVISNDCIAEIVTRLSKLNAASQTKSVNVDETVKNVFEHATENLIDEDIDSEALKEIICNILQKLHEFDD